jgi:hypothetical protein
MAREMLQDNAGFVLFFADVYFRLSTPPLLRQLFPNRLADPIDCDRMQFIPCRDDSDIRAGRDQFPNSCVSCLVVFGWQVNGTTAESAQDSGNDLAGLRFVLHYFDNNRFHFSDE